MADLEASTADLKASGSPSTSLVLLKEEGS